MPDHPHALRPRHQPAARGLRLATLFLCLASSAGLAQQDLTEAATAFEDVLQRIETNHQQTLTDLPKAYLAGLESLLVQYRAKGELDPLLVIAMEKRRYEKQATIPMPPDPKAPAPIAKLQADYHEAVAQAAGEKSRRILDLAGRYHQQLEALQRRLTQEGRIEDAVKVKEAREAIHQIPAVSAADFALGVMTNASPGIPAGTPPATMVACQTCLGKGRMPATCATCGGSGRCAICRGSGKLRAALSAGHRHCLQCKGTGQCRPCTGTGQMATGATCTACKGEGRTRATAVP